MEPQDIEPGRSYGCRFRIKTYLDENRQPVELNELPQNPGSVKTGDWVSWGLIEKRDRQNQLLSVRDQRVDRTWTLHYSEVWDIDLAEYREDAND